MPLLRSSAALPGQCVLCHGWGTARLCGACWAQEAPHVSRCRRCAIAVPEGFPECGDCLRAPPPFAATIAVLDYRPPWSALVARFKFHDGLDLGGVFAQRLAAACREVSPRPTLILPVPLAEDRLRERGYNQACRSSRGARQPDGRGRGSMAWRQSGRGAAGLRRRYSWPWSCVIRLLARDVPS